MLIYKIATRAEWTTAVADGAFRGAPIDLEDGFIHFSNGAQVKETAAKHFSGRDNLVLVAVDADALGAELKWEPSRGGALFPHLYRPLATAEAVWVAELPLGPDGRHQFPALEGR